MSLFPAVFVSFILLKTSSSPGKLFILKEDAISRQLICFCIVSCDPFMCYFLGITQIGVVMVVMCILVQV